MKPVFVSPEGKSYKCCGWACGFPKINWEWYAFEDMKDGTYFGYVMGFENEFGYFSEAELKESGIVLIKDNRLNDIAPPIGWTRKELVNA